MEPFQTEVILAEPRYKRVNQSERWRHVCSRSALFRPAGDLEEILSDFRVTEIC